MINRAVFLAFSLILAAVASASAQTKLDAVELAIGHAAAVDESPIHHAAVGAVGRLALSPRVHVGPELFFFSGPGDDRDLLLNGQVWWALNDEQARVVPYLSAGAGVMTTSIRGFTSTGWAWNGGGGVRVAVTDRVYIAPDFRLGFEMFTRATVAIGYRWNR